MKNKICVAIVLCAAAISVPDRFAFAAGEPIEGKPTNLDQHGDVVHQHDAPSGVDRATAKQGFVPQATEGEPAVPPVENNDVTTMAGGVQAITWTKGVVPVVTRSFDNLRWGTNTKEKVLTPANVAKLKKAFTIAIKDDPRGCEAQPLLIPNIKLTDGSIHDLCIVCSMANTVFAFDANNGAPLWEHHLGKPINGNRDIDGWLINKNWGILSTPVVDPDQKILYCVSWSDGDGNWKTGVHRFHSLRLTDGADAAPAIDLSSATFDPGHGLPLQKFKDSERKQRSGLTLATVKGRKTVFIPFGTIKETSAGARGWMVAIDVPSNSIGATWCSTARFSGGGIWMAGQGPAVDGAGNLYFLTGNGSFDGVTEFGESFVHLTYTPPKDGAAGALKVADWFSPFSDSGRAGGPQDGVHITVDNGGGWDDMDLGAGGVVLIPAKKLVGGSGKDGIWYSLATNKMGKTLPADFKNPATNYAKAKWIGWFTYYNPDTPPTPQRFTDLNQLYAGRTHHEHSSPVVFKSANHGIMIFCGGENGNLRAWSVNDDLSLKYLGNGAEVASSQSPVPPGGMPGMMLAISANGTKNGIVWATCPMTDANRQISKGVLFAYDATNFGKYADGTGAIKLLWTSPQYIYNKFNPPVVSGGKVYVPTYDGKVDVYAVF